MMKQTPGRDMLTEQKRKKQKLPDSMVEMQMLEKHGYGTLLLLGEGAFARVYKAWDNKNKRMVACKVSRKEDIWRGETEALKGTKHPLFPVFFTCFREGERQVIVLEYISGATLEELLRRRGALSESAARKIIIEIAEGLRYLHEKPSPCVFRDIKPDNIIIREDGRVKLIDFGCVGKPGSKAVVGSRGYAAPEQLLGTKPVGLYSDVYSVGRVLQKTLGKKYHGVLTEVVDACTRMQPEERIPDMRFLIGELCHINRWRKRRKSLLNQYRCKKNIHIYCV